MKILLIASALSFLAHIPGSALSIARIVTDGAEVVTDNLHKGAVKVDVAMDKMEEYFHQGEGQGKAVKAAKKHNNK